MPKDQLNLEETREMFIQVSQKMMESTDQLTQADKAIGDGDHGVGMARGFEAALKKLEGQAMTAMDEMVKAIGTAFITSVGGSAGAIFGTFFRSAAKNLAGQQVLDSHVLSLILLDGLQAVKERGKAKAGDKTMVDALEPAAQKAQELATAPLHESLKGVAEAARQGMEKTKEMVATLGRAKTLGERSLGHPDPGALSTYLILKYMMEYTQ
jgi:phosphoenolpyruvate---glycerone phosphotransferase subunit DhaL